MGGGRVGVDDTLPLMVIPVIVEVLVMGCNVISLPLALCLFSHRRKEGSMAPYNYARCNRAQSHDLEHKLRCARRTEHTRESRAATRWLNLYMSLTTAPEVLSCTTASEAKIILMQTLH
jgi:hypothetical protein